MKKNLRYGILLMPYYNSLQEATSQDQSRRLQRQLRDLKENYTTLQQKETEVNAKKNEYEKKLELGKKNTMNDYNCVIWQFGHAFKH